MSERRYSTTHAIKFYYRRPTPGVHRDDATRLDDSRYKPRRQSAVPNGKIRGNKRPGRTLGRCRERRELGGGTSWRRGINMCAGEVWRHLSRYIDKRVRPVCV